MATFNLAGLLTGGPKAGLRVGNATANAAPQPAAVTLAGQSMEQDLGGQTLLEYCQSRCRWIWPASGSSAT
jgi:hypothetical protein